MMFTFMDSKLDKEMGAAKVEEAASDEEFKLSDVGAIFGSKLFWIIAMLCVLYYSAIFPSSVMRPICFSATSASPRPRLPIFSAGSPSVPLCSPLPRLFP